MATPALFTLTQNGVLTPGKALMSRLLIYFITSEYSQSVIYHGKISSLKYLLMQYGNDDQKLITEINYALSELYKRYFDTVDIKADVLKYNDSKYPKKIQRVLTISIEATYNGNLYTINEDLDITNNIISDTDIILENTIK